MPLPERPNQNIDASSPSSERTATLADVERQLEFIDGNENPIERFFKREQLLERRYELQSEPTSKVGSSNGAT